MLDTHTCPGCRQSLPEDVDLSGALSSCPACSNTVRVLAFPAIAKIWTPAEPRVLHEDSGDSPCFYHEQNVAEVPCSHCGRYLCALCAIDHQELTYCANCLETFYENSQNKKLWKPGNPFHIRSSISVRAVVLVSMIAMIFFLFPMGIFFLAMLIAMGGVQ